MQKNMKNKLKYVQFSKFQHASNLEFPKVKTVKMEMK